MFHNRGDILNIKDEDMDRNIAEKAVKYFEGKEDKKRVDELLNQVESESESYRNFKDKYEIDKIPNGKLKLKDMKEILEKHKELKFTKHKLKYYIEQGILSEPYVLKENQWYYSRDNVIEYLFLNEIKDNVLWDTIKKFFDVVQNPINVKDDNGFEEILDTYFRYKEVFNNILSNHKEELYEFANKQYSELLEEVEINENSISDVDKMKLRDLFKNEELQDNIKEYYRKALYYKTIINTCNMYMATGKMAFELLDNLLDSVNKEELEELKNLKGLFNE